MSCLCVTCLLAALFTSEQQVAAISVLMLSLNFFSATQDVATDSLAVRILDSRELGMGNTVQVIYTKA